MPNSKTRITLILLAAAAFAPAAFSATSITPQGVGPIKLGARYTDLKAKGLVEAMSPGCEVAGPNTRSAKLRPPLKGSVDLTLSEPRRVTTITIYGGATARGVGVGATTLAIKAAFPAAKFDRSGEQTFGVTFVEVPRGKGGPIAFAVSAKSKRVEQIAVPNVTVCD
jgi:hypothetical protein